jgi:type VII secretion protein EccE
MTESPARVRAVARVRDVASRTGPAILLPRRRPGRLGPVHVVQLLLIEGVALGVLAALAFGPPMAGAVGLVGLVLVLIALARRRGRWWLESRLMAWQYRRRRHYRPDGFHDDARLRGLQWLAPGLSVRDVPAPDGTQIGVARDDAGWYAVATVRPAAAMRDAPADGLPVDRLVRVLHDAAAPGAVLQVVTHTVPAPSLELDRGCPASQSYLELLQTNGPVPVPRDRVTWITVRLDARSMAEEAPIGGAETQPPALVGTLLRRVVGVLRRTGRACQILDADGLLDALARSCDLEPPTAPGAPARTAQPVRPHEDWSAWHSARLAHTSYWVQDWSPVVQAGALLDGLSAAPAALTSVTLIMAPQDDTIDLRCLARVAAPVESLAQSGQELVLRARQAHARLFRLDGEQAPAVYATAPTGGGPR